MILGAGREAEGGGSMVGGCIIGVELGFEGMDSWFMGGEPWPTGTVISEGLGKGS